MVIKDVIKLYTDEVLKNGAKPDTMTKVNGVLQDFFAWSVNADIEVSFNDKRRAPVGATK